MNSTNTDEDTRLPVIVKEGEQNVHLFRDLLNTTKSATVNLYTKFNLRSQVLQDNFKKLNTKTEPLLEKVTTILDLGLNKVKTQVTPITQKVSDVKNTVVTKTIDSKKKVGELLNRATESGKQTQIFKTAEKFSIDILTHLQKDVNDLENRVYSFRKTQHKKVEEQEDQKEDSLETSSSFSRQNDQDSRKSGQRSVVLNDNEENDDQRRGDQNKITQRVKRLTKKINNISKTMADSSLEFIDGSIPVQKIKKVATFAAVPVRESLIFSQVLRDMMFENFMVPVYQMASVQFAEGSKFVQVAITSPKKTFLESVWPSVSETCANLQNSTILVSNNTIKFIIEKKNFTENYAQIIDQVQQVKESSIKSVFVAQEQSCAAYLAALNEFKERREKYLTNEVPQTLEQAEAPQESFINLARQVPNSDEGAQGSHNIDEDGQGDKEENVSESL